MSFFLQLKSNPLRKLSFMACIILLVSCNSTRFVPEGKYLLNRISVKSDNKNLKREELKIHVRQKENLRILGVLKFHLGVYNLSSGKKNNDWLDQQLQDVKDAPPYATITVERLLELIEKVEVDPKYGAKLWD